MTGVGWLAGMQYWCRRIDPACWAAGRTKLTHTFSIVPRKRTTSHFQLLLPIYIVREWKEESRIVFALCIFKTHFLSLNIKFVCLLIILQWYDWKPELVVSHDFSWFSRSRPLFPDRIAAASHWPPQPLQDQIWGRSRRRQISVARWGGGEASGHLRPLRTSTQPSREASGFSRAGKGDDSRFPGNVVTCVYKGYMTADIL